MPQSQERILGEPAYPLLRLGQKFLSWSAEYDDVIRGSSFKPCLGPPTLPLEIGTKDQKFQKPGSQQLNSNKI